MSYINNWQRLCAGLAVLVLFSTGSYASAGVLNNKVSINAGGGWSRFSMSQFNDDYIDVYLSSEGYLDDHIDNGPHLMAEVEYLFAGRISASLGLSYLSAKVETDYDYWIRELDGLIGPYDATTQLKTTLVAPEVKLRYRVPLRFGDAYLGGGAAWCFGKATIRGDSDFGSSEYKMTGDGLGFQGLAGISFDLNRWFSLGAEFGYRHYVTEPASLKLELEGTDDGEDKVGVAVEMWPALELGFNGLYASVVVSLKL
jgi:opacity protein-like surface antigen